MPSNDSSQVAVVTGASSGVGEVIARTLARDGYRLALLARPRDVSLNEILIRPTGQAF